MTLFDGDGYFKQGALNQGVDDVYQDNHCQGDDDFYQCDRNQVGGDFYQGDGELYHGNDDLNQSELRLIVIKYTLPKVNNGNINKSEFLLRLITKMWRGYSSTVGNSKSIIM